MLSRITFRTVLIVGLIGGLAGLSAGCTGAPAEGAGVVTITTPTPPPPPALVAGSISSEPGPLALAAATNIVFNIMPSGGKAPYTVSWNFGDGSAPLVALVGTHVFLNTGNFSVVATVTDADGKTAMSPMHMVRVRNVTGRWRVTFGGAALLPEDMDIIQNGTELIVSTNTPGGGLGTGTGSVSNARAMSVMLTFGEKIGIPFSVTLVGSVTSDLTTWTGTALGYNVCPCNFTAQRSQPPQEPTLVSSGAPVSTP